MCAVPPQRRREAGSTSQGWECVIAALFVLAAVLLTVPAIVRAGRRARLDADRDAPARVLAFAVTGLPETHREWGRPCPPSSKRCAAGVLGGAPASAARV